jgi:hypothetical protein
MNQMRMNLACSENYYGQLDSLIDNGLRVKDVTKQCISQYAEGYW